MRLRYPEFADYRRRNDELIKKCSNNPTYNDPNPPNGIQADISILDLDKLLKEIALLNREKNILLDLASKAMELHRQICEDPMKLERLAQEGLQDLPGKDLEGRVEGKVKGEE
jgi:hypothetical protein